MGNPEQTLVAGLATLGVEVGPETAPRLWQYAELMLRWNRQVNLTAITDPREVADKHLLDSLGPLPEVAVGARVLDLGAGAGLPGIPWALARPDLHITLVDAVQKKVAFIKTAIATFQLAGRVKAVHLHATGEEQLGTFDLAVSRAFMDVGPWLGLAVRFVPVGARVMAMVARVPDGLEALAKVHGCVVSSTRTFTLPLSGDPRAVLMFQKTDQLG